MNKIEELADEFIFNSEGIGFDETGMFNELIELNINEKKQQKSLMDFSIFTE